MTNTNVSDDGRYSIRQNASHCTIDAIDTKSNKILALAVVDKKYYFHPKESFDKTSNLMESEAMRRLLKQLGYYKNKICGFALDGDNKKLKILNQENFHPIVCKDPNHLLLAFKKYLDTQLSEFKRMIPVISDCIRNRLEEVWLNTVTYLLSDHDKCFYHKETSFVWRTGQNHPDTTE